MEIEPFITTFSGRKVNPLALRVEDVVLIDVAHHLACTNRFVGALREPLPDAQHCVLVSHLLAGTGFEYHGLHHDDSEAYLGDMSKWVKQHESMVFYRECEEVAQRACNAYFHVEWSAEVQEAVGWADRLAVRYEAERGFANGCHMFDLPGYEHTTPAEQQKVPFTPWAAGFFWTWRFAKEMYLKRHHELRPRHVSNR